MSGMSDRGRVGTKQEPNAATVFFNLRLTNLSVPPTTEQRSNPRLDVLFLENVVSKIVKLGQQEKK